MQCGLRANKHRQGAKCSAEAKCQMQQTAPDATAFLLISPFFFFFFFFISLLIYIHAYIYTYIHTNSSSVRTGYHSVLSVSLSVCLSPVLLRCLLRAGCLCTYSDRYY